MKELTPEQRKQRIETIVKLAIAFSVSLMAAPIIFVAIKGAIGLLIAACLGIGAVNLAPLVGMKFANWRLKAIKAEAMRNPVETLQNEYTKKKAALADYRENITKFSAQVLAFSDQVKQYVKDQLEDAPTYVEQLSKMKQLLELRKRKYGEAQDALAEFSETIERTDRKWKMAVAAVAMSEAAGQIDGDVFSKICIETAVDSVTAKLNQSFADMDIALLDEVKQNQPQLAAPTRMQVLEINQTETVKVNRV